MPGRIRRSRWPRVFFFTALMLVFIVGWWWEDRYLPQSGWQRPQGQIASGEYSVSRVIDGDTIVLQQDDLVLRLQGIDTPETVKPNTPVEAWGTAASEFTRQFLNEADWIVEIRIEGEPVDRYGRHLGFVWHDGRLLNEELVRHGLAQARTSFDFSQAMKLRLRQAQQDAQESQLGIWGNQ